MSCFSCSALANHCEHLCSSCFQQYGIERCNMCPALEQKMAYPCLSSVSSVSSPYVPPRRYIEMPAPSSFSDYNPTYSPSEFPCSSEPSTPRTYWRRMEEMFSDDLALASPPAPELSPDNQWLNFGLTESAAGMPSDSSPDYLALAPDADADDIEQIEKLTREIENAQLQQALADIAELERKADPVVSIRYVPVLATPSAPHSVSSAPPSVSSAPPSVSYARPSAPPALSYAPPAPSSAPPVLPSAQASIPRNQCCFVTCSILLHMNCIQLRDVMLNDKQLPAILRREIEQQQRVGDDIFEHVGRIFNVTFELFIQTAEKERVYLGYRGIKPSRHSIKHCVMFEPFGLTFDEYAKMPFHSLMDNGHWEPMLSGTSDVVDPPKHWVESVEIFRQLSR
jgi:hypothetical protein